MRSLLLGVAVVCLVAGAAVATPTKPLVMDVEHLPWQCLMRQHEHHRSALQLLPCPHHHTHKHHQGDLVLARARYSASLYKLGWDYLEVEARRGAEGPHSAVDYHHMGFIEGYLTADRVANVLGGQLNHKTEKWIRSHIHYMESNAGQRHNTSKFWASVGNLLAQMRGIAEGTNAALNHTKYTMYDVFLYNFRAEVPDVETAISVGESSPAQDSELLPPRRVGEHCSALIKVLPNDMYVSHDTWNAYNGMTFRTYKKYTAGPVTVAFSSYPAFVASGDDWYTINHFVSHPRRTVQLAVQETTNEVFNRSLYRFLTPFSVSEFIRVMTANYVAQNGSEWTDLFASENSGTYNNQYMVVDYSRYTPGSPLMDGLLFVAEQIPGLVESSDVTDVLRRTGYWASYNTPYFRTIYDMSGYPEMLKKQGSYWSYTKYARPEIFRRDNHLVVDVPSMMRMMRYNNYQRERYSIIPNCEGADEACRTTHSSMLTIASRGDLMPLYNTTAEMKRHYGPLYNLVAQGCFGAVDSKISTWSHRDTMTAYIISGPTNDNEPTFSYGSQACPEAPRGSSVTFDFPWVQWKLPVIHRPHHHHH